MKTAAVTLAIGLCGCTLSSTTRLPQPRAGESAAPNVASIQTVGSELMGYAPDDLVSRASLLRMDREATCFDVVFRGPLPAAARSPISPLLKFTIEIDGGESASFEGQLDGCTSEHACLPGDSPLGIYAMESRPRVGSSGARLCVAGLPRAKREIALLQVTPIGTAAFRFRFDARP